MNKEGNAEGEGEAEGEGRREKGEGGRRVDVSMEDKKEYGCLEAR